MGEGIPQDYKEAVKWYRLAADQGEYGGQLLLGHMYVAGNGVPEDFVQAHKWFNLAGSSGQEAAVKQRDAIAARMTSEDVAQAQALARDWKSIRTAAEKR